MSVSTLWDTVASVDLTPGDSLVSILEAGHTS